jgi:bacterioferritin
MKGNPEIIKALNEILCGELTSVNQYFLHARMMNNWGYTKIGKVVYKESIDEMKHSQVLIDRILFLEGIPNLQKLGALNIGETVPEQLESDKGLETIAIPRVRDAIKLCEEKMDHGTREMLLHILADEERHLDWLETQLHLIGALGAQNYLTQQIETED